MKKYISIVLIIAISLLVGCANDNTTKKDTDGKLVVYTSFYPQYYLAKEIGKDKIDIHSIVPNGVEPHDFEPSMKQIKEVQNANIVVYNGADMEHWMDKLLETIDKKEVDIINSSEFVELVKLEGRPDPHIWLDPLNMDKIGLEIKNSLVKMDEKNQEFYEKNYAELSSKLQKLNEEYEAVLKDKKRDTILVSHSAFTYITEKYDIEQISVTGISPEEEPSPKVISELIDIAKTKELEYIFLETLASPKTADIIAEEAKLEVLTLNPLEGLTKKEENNGEDYISIMEKNLENLKKALVD
ncbi:zinc ABC transporter substrate-binding protein [Anaerosalibacter bizertensis]|uniref:Zinc ABC transporter substrate-binding protein n=1 Tax=Anaerosalibacter bizertensis TaxID=932217 RepID=A0A9Q4ADT8_9FIRM|nr:zinc ABC transporter substrate-binding protein [Anaerosalibacter bizertensis]MBV1818617.1 zinc ABC transporter substrate-binding protein [Bacteroidales bacterium MSK.15.36]MCB5558686.1 zinc ABC transporter substrate-binding protein [Anaerosalibacter bizertensis]MCG4565801.1 zinc ABC transporter substrate-binding protein [Anaerosalibacter bizertensis]MCG4582733.1 zinc ABC transporter substrate-binding protein [Anaerosalibacter bizertensis]MCG4585341.1 zinc ABC transporter substrate-binding p